MDIIIKGVQEKIKNIEGVAYVDEDWGQLDYYSPNFPVQWPCVLIDVSEADFQNIGRDNKQSPINRQTANVIVSLTIANLRLTNSSGFAPIHQKNEVQSIHKLIKKIHATLHGQYATDNTGKLMRVKMRRVKRDDGVQEYNVSYSLGATNV